MAIDVFTRTDSPYWFASLLDDGKRPKASLRLPAKGPHAVKRQVALKAAEALQAKLATAPAVQTLRGALDAYCDYLEAEGKPFARNAKALRDKLLGLRPVARQKAGAVPAGFHLDPAMPVSELTPQLLTKLVDARRKEGCSAQTITHEIGVLRAAVRRATARDVDIPRIVVENTWVAPKVLQKTRYLEWPEWLRLYAALSPDRDIIKVRKATGKDYPPMRLTGAPRQGAQDVQDLLVALTLTGGRWSEVAGLRWSKIDLDAGVARLWGSKTGRERLVPLPAQFQEVLRRRRAEAPEDALFVFPGIGGERRTAPSSAIREAMDRVGLNSDPATVKAHGKATIHSLRHTFASWLLQNGADLAAVQDVLGHANITMTRRYAHLEKARTAKQMGAILSNIGALNDA